MENRHKQLRIAITYFLSILTFLLLQYFARVRCSLLCLYRILIETLTMIITYIEVCITSEIYEKSKFILKNRFLKLDNWNRYNFLYFLLIERRYSKFLPNKSNWIFNQRFSIYNFNNFISNAIICMVYCFYFLLILNKLNF